MNLFLNPGWMARLLTHPVQGLSNYRLLIDTLTSGKGVIKALLRDRRT